MDSSATRPPELPENPDATVAGSVRARTQKERILKVISETAFLPPAFELIPRLLLLLDNSEANSEILADLVQVDAALTANVLRVSNSVSFAGAARTETLLEAILRLGLRAIYEIVVEVITSPILSEPQEPGIGRMDLWAHSLASAVAARLLAAKSRGEDPEVAFTAALLHDLGKVVLGRSLRGGYFDLAQKCVASKTPLHEVEKETFEIDHAEIGARLLQHWAFPDNIVAAIRWHHNPNRCPASHQRLATLIYGGDILAYRIGHGPGYPTYVATPNAAWLREADLAPSDLQMIEGDVREEFARQQERFG